MPSHPSLYGQPLPGVRELFPDLFPRPMTSPQTPPLSMTYEQQRTADDFATTPPSIPAPRHPRPPRFDRPTAQDTATGTADHDHPYTRPHPERLAPAPPHAQPHVPGTHLWPENDLAGPSSSRMSPTYTPSAFSSPHSQPRSKQIEHGGVDQYTLPDNEQPSSPMTPPSHMASNPAEFALRPTSFDQNLVETHSGKKRHKCDVCGSYWGRPSSLKIHMVSHTGVKEFMCSICKQDFGVKSNYTRHIRVHHKDSSEGIQTRAAGRRRRGSRRNQDVGPVRFVDEGPRFQGQ